MDGGPEIVGGNYDCTGNSIKTFRGLPKKLGGYLICDQYIAEISGFADKVVPDTHHAMLNNDDLQILRDKYYAEEKLQQLKQRMQTVSDNKEDKAATGTRKPKQNIRSY